jgi:hypothetical protein
MAKRLTMAEIDTILTLHKAGHSSREIAALVGVNRETVGKHLARAKAGNQPNAPTGNPSDDPNPDQPNAPTGSAGSPSNGPRSKCEAFREEILAKIEQDLEAVRIHQDLVVDHGDIAPSYYSVRRFVARLRQKVPLPFRRMETGPAGNRWARLAGIRSNGRCVSRWARLAGIAPALLFFSVCFTLPGETELGAAEEQPNEG